MPLTYRQLQDILSRHTDAILQLQTLYTEMDARYTAAAESYDFECRGCDDNCCLTRFYHHTLIEFAGLFSGYLELPEDQQRRITKRAQAYCQILETAGGQDRPLLRHLCPLNENTLCLLYKQRPMICRLHGIPHVMRHPGRGLITGTGCHIFEATCRTGNGHALDRTPLYRAMAHLEKSLRHATGIDLPVRLTIAQMIVSFDE